MWHGKPVAQDAGAPAADTLAALRTCDGRTATPVLRSASAGAPNETAAKRSGAQSRDVIRNPPHRSSCQKNGSRVCVASRSPPGPDEVNRKATLGHGWLRLESQKCARLNASHG